MKRKYYPHIIIGYTLFFLLAASSVGCSGDSEERQEQRLPVSFSLEFNKPQTRSTLDNIWPDNTQITISDGTGKTYLYQTASNSSTLTSGAPTSLSPVSDLIYWDNPNVRFSAWYPAGGTAAPTSLTVAADQGSLTHEAYLAYDLLYCPPEITIFTFRQSAPISLQFHHELSRIIVIINSSYTEGHEETVGDKPVMKKEVVDNVSFGGNRLALSGDITHSTTGLNGSTTWTLTGATNLSISNMRPLASETNAPNNIYAFECILPPQSDNSEAPLIDITTSGAIDYQKAPVARTYTYKSAFDFKSGYQYTYNLIVSEQGTVTLDRVKVEDWGDTVEVENEAVIRDNDYSGVTTP